MKKFAVPLLALLTLAVAVLPGAAEDWPQWRGPKFNGSASGKNFPATWSKTENIAWVAPMPGASGATPVTWGERVFVSTADANKNLLLLCLNAADGKEIWRQQVATGDRSTDQGNNMASPSPVTDGRRVIAMYGTGDLAAFDLSGKPLWNRNLSRESGKLSYMWLYGASPLLFEGRLYVQVLQRDPPSYPHAVDDKPTRDSFLLCIDPASGKDLWRHVRKTDALDESQESYSTPVPFQGRNGTEIVVVGGDCVTGHNAKTGAEIWRAGGLNSKKSQWWRIITSPVVSEEFIYASAPKREPLIAIRGGGHGEITESHVAWKFTDNPPDVCTPLYYQGKLFVLDGDRKMLTCLDPKTGEKKWAGDLGVREVFKASPTGADGRVYCVSERGTAVVLDAGPEFKVLSTIPMGEGPVRSSIAAANGRLYLRTAQNLYCIGRGK